MAISVVIASYQRAGEIGACLEALAGQTPAPVKEVIVVDSSPGTETAEIVRERFPTVRLIRSTERLGPHQARNLGAAAARGEVIAFTDADCVPAATWASRLASAHAEGADVVGGSIDPDSPAYLERAVNLCKFNLWLEGLAAGPRATIPTANLSLTRAAWERLGPFRVGGWSGDTELVWRAREVGFEPRFEPTAIVAHRDRDSFGPFLRDRVERGRAFATLRVRSEGWTRRRALLHLLGSPATALLLTARGAVMIARSGRPVAAVGSLPVYAPGFAAWALGEARLYARMLTGRLPA